MREPNRLHRITIREVTTAIPVESDTNDPTTVGALKEDLHGARISVRTKLKKALTALVAGAALLGANSSGNDGHGGSACGCGVCRPPQVTRRQEEDDDEGDDKEGNGGKKKEI